VRETWGEGSFTGNPEGYVKKALETSVFLNRGPTGGNREGTLLCGDFEGKGRF